MNTEVRPRTIPEINRDLSKLQDNLRFQELLLTAEWLEKEIQHELDKIAAANRFIEFLYSSLAKAPAEIDRLKGLIVCTEEELLHARQAQATENFAPARRAAGTKPAVSVSKLLQGIDTKELILQAVMKQHGISRECAQEMIGTEKVGQL